MSLIKSSWKSEQGAGIFPAGRAEAGHVLCDNKHLAQTVYKTHTAPSFIDKQKTACRGYLGDPRQSGERDHICLQEDKSVRFLLLCCSSLLPSCLLFAERSSRPSAGNISPKQSPAFPRAPQGSRYCKNQRLLRA